MRQRLERAFTLVELVIVIAIVGILAAIAIPQFIDIRSEAYIAQRDGIIGSVRAGILTVAAKNQVNQLAGTFPPNLEATWNTITGGTQEANGTACGPLAAKACFELVVPGGFVDANWTETSTAGSDPTVVQVYTFTAPVGSGTKAITYTQANGTFQ